MKKILVLSGFCFALILGGCSGEPQPVAKKAPPEAVTGLTALFRMYQVARSWASDAQVLKMTSIDLTDVPEVRGKAGAWRATFTSESRSAARVYTYSAEETEPNLHLGVFGGQQESWSPGSADKPFVIAGVKIDTDAAYQTALTNAAESAKKNPTQTISFLLEKLDKFTSPSWRVIWGESVGTSGLSVYVDASTGAYLETMH